MDIRKFTDRRVVITGLGPVSPVGIGKDAFWDSLKNSRSNFRTITRYPTDKTKTKIAAEVNVFVPELKNGKLSDPPPGFEGLNVGEYVSPKTLRKIQRFKIPFGGWSLYYAICAARLAVEDAQLDFSNMDMKRVGMTISAASGDAQLCRYGPAVFDITQYGGMGGLTGTIAYEFGIQGTGIPNAGACASGVISLRAGYLEIMSGAQDVILSGATSAALASPILFEAYDEPRYGGPMSQINDLDRPMKPFDVDRSGFILGEGAGIIILEELEHAKRRGAKIYAEVLGVGHSTDTANHFADISKEGYINSMRSALQSSGLSEEEIANSSLYLNAHGSATEKNDACEIQAIKEVFGIQASSLLVSSIKGITGHGQEAASAHELISCALSLDEGITPETLGLRNLAAECEGVNHITGKARYTNIDYALKNASGFCGPYATAVLKKYKS